jgi:hypothetical protein
MSIGETGAVPIAGEPAELDITAEPDLSSPGSMGSVLGSADGPPLGAPALKKTNRWDDAARVGLAFILVGLLAFVVIVTTIAVVTGKASQETTVDAYLKVVLSPIIGIVGSVVGFYFGAKSQGAG